MANFQNAQLNIICQKKKKKNTQIFIGSVFVPKTTAQGYILEFTSAKYEVLELFYMSFIKPVTTLITLS